MFVAPQAASACNWNIGVSDLRPNELRTVLYDVQLVAQYGTQRGKWNNGNRHTTAMSYSYVWDPGTYEVNEIPAYNTDAQRFTTAHPSYFQYGGNDIDVRVRNKGPRHTLTMSGQVCL